MAVILKYKALLYQDDTLYASKGSALYASKDSGTSFELLGKMDVKGRERLLEATALSRRVSRTGIHMLRKNDAGDLIAVTRGAIHARCAGASSFVKVFSIPRGSRPLGMSFGKFGECLWGEYFGNDERDSVKIYRSKTPYTSWEVCHTFPAGSIRHVHNIIFDEVRDGYWVLTGDYNQEAAIWFASVDFTQVELMTSGTQLDRAVVILPEEDRLVGATDTQLEDNYIYTIELDRDKPKQTLLKKIEGPCFDLVRCSDMYICSSVIEKSDVNLSPYVHLYASMDGKLWKEILKFKKDIYPTKMHFLTQFSTVSLVSSEESEYLYMFGRGVKEINQVTKRIHYSELKQLLNDAIQ